MQALAAPLFLLFAIVTIVAFCALVMQLWGRLIILNVLLVLCPLAVVLAATPQTAGWAARWRDQFLAATFSQALSLLALALATQLAAPIFLAGQPGMSALAALGGLWLAYQAPRWLRDHAVPSVVGLAGTVSPVAAVATIDLTMRRVRALAGATPAGPCPRAGRRPTPAAGAPGLARPTATAPIAASTDTAGAVAVPAVPPTTGRRPPVVGAPVAWDERQGRWVMPAALPRSGAPVRPLPHLGVAVVLPTDRPYVLNEEDGMAWLADPDALPTDRRRVRLGRDRAGNPVALIAPDAHTRGLGRGARPPDGPASARRPMPRPWPTPPTTRRRASWPARRRTPFAPPAAGPRRSPGTPPAAPGWPPRATPAPSPGTRPPAPSSAPTPTRWRRSTRPAATGSSRRARCPAGRPTPPVETIEPVTVPATAYPAEPAEPTAVPMTRRPLETVPLMPVPDASLGEGRGQPPTPSLDADARPPRPPAPRPIAFPGPRRRP